MTKEGFNSVTLIGLIMHVLVAIGVLVSNGAEMGGFDCYLATPL